MISNKTLTALFLIAALIGCTKQKSDSSKDDSGGSEALGPCANVSATALYNALGSGTSDTPYVICNVSQLVSFATTPAAWSSSFKLQNDVDLQPYYTAGGSDFQIASCGTETCIDGDAAESAFTGSFDGNGKKLLNFRYVTTTAVGAGLFAKTNGATIQHLALQSVNVQGTNTVGALVGYSIGGVISDCSSSGTVTGSSSSVGGLVGNGSASISSSSSNANVSGLNFIGGLVGTHSGAISASYATGSVSGAGFVGGLVGRMTAGSISLSHASGAVTASANSVGGLLGNGSAGTVSKSYATANVTGASNVGGLIGLGVTTSDSYASGNVSGTSNVGGLIGNVVLNVMIANSYSSGNVNASSNYAGGLIGSNSAGNVSGSFSVSNVTTAGASSSRMAVGLGGSISHSYVWAGSACMGSCTATETGSHASRSDFTDLTQVPLSSWDFASVWQISASAALPALR